MVPEFIQSRFEAYKKDTNAVAIWLAATAKRFGYPTDLLTSDAKVEQKPTNTTGHGRLKGKARKMAKAAQSTPSTTASPVKPDASGPVYSIPVKDFISLSEFIAGKPAVQVPIDFIKTIDRAILLRRRSHGWYRKQTGDDQKKIADDHGHRHFLGILEKTREVLKPRMINSDGISADFGGSGASERTASSEGNAGIDGTNAHDDDQDGNMFHGLEVHEPSDAFLNAPNIVADPRPEARQDRYQVKSSGEDLMEQYLALHCLFTDILNVRNSIQNLWHGYKQGYFDIVSASIAANTSIEFIRGLEEDFIKQNPSRSSYEDMQSLFYSAQCHHRGVDPLQRNSPDDPFPFEVYDLAEDTCLPAYIIMEALSHVVSPGYVPMYKPGHFGVLDTQTPWDRMSPREKFQHDKILLLELFPDLVLLSQFMGKPLVEDELIRGVRDIRDEGAIPLWLAFAAQVFLDTNHILGREAARGFYDLVEGTACIKASVKQTKDFHKNLRVDNWPKSNDRAFDQVLDEIEHWVTNDAVKAKLRKAHPSGANLIPDHRLLTQHPLLCGLYLFRFKFLAQDIGLAFVNAWGSIKYSGQLYHAARRSKHVTKPWQDMETVFALQGPENFFIGDFPKSAEEDFRRFCLSIGYSATNFAANRRSGGAIKASPKGPQGLASLCALGRIFEGRYCQNEAAVIWNRDAMEKIIQSKVEDDSDDDDCDDKVEASNPSQRRTAAAARTIKQSRTGTLFKPPKPLSKNADGPPQDTLSLPSFIQSLACALHAEHLELTFDYLRVHRMCWTFLRTVNDKCRPFLLETYGPGYLEKENQLPFVVGYIFMTATNTERVAGLLLPRRRGEDGHIEATSRVLGEAGRVIQGMIESGAGGVECRVLRERHGLEMGLSEMEAMTLEGG